MYGYALTDCLLFQDMIIPKVWKHGITFGTTAAIAVGVATIYGLDFFITYFDLQADGFEGGMGEAGPVLPLSDTKGKADAAAAQTARAKSALLTALALAAHNAPEGLAVGMASMQEAEAKERGEVIGDKESRHTFLVVRGFDTIS